MLTPTRSIAPISAFGIAALTTALAWSGACNVDSGQGDPFGQGSGIPGLDPQDDDHGATDTDNDPDQDSGDDLKLDIPGGAADGRPSDNDECAAVSAQAESTKQPADIIFVVDNSGSMTFEVHQIQAQMNGSSQQIIASGIDVRVVLVSSYPFSLTNPFGGNGICISPPLGSGGCPVNDSNPPVYTHVDRKVSSNDAWEKLLETHPQWASAVRPEASKHIVIVTDDVSDMPMSTFDTAFKALDPDYGDYVHHSVVCHSDCASAAGIGTNYINLSMQTSGVAADLCAQDFQSVFDVLSTEVINGSQLACEWEIPAPPDGMDFDPNAVNVDVIDTAGAPRSIGMVDSPADCASVSSGWYYDDPSDPEFIIFCDQTCEEVQNVQNGSISIAFGCATIPAG